MPIGILHAHCVLRIRGPAISQEPELYWALLGFFSQPGMLLQVRRNKQILARVPVWARHDPIPSGDEPCGFLGVHMTCIVMLCATPAARKGSQSGQLTS